MFLIVAEQYAIFQCKPLFSKQEKDSYFTSKQLRL